MEFLEIENGIELMELLEFRGNKIVGTDFQPFRKLFRVDNYGQFQSNLWHIPLNTVPTIATSRTDGIFMVDSATVQCLQLRIASRIDGIFMAYSATVLTIAASQSNFFDILRSTQCRRLRVSSPIYGTFIVYTAANQLNSYGIFMASLPIEPVYLSHVIAIHTECILYYVDMCVLGKVRVVENIGG